MYANFDQFEICINVSDFVVLSVVMQLWPFCNDSKCKLQSHFRANSQRPKVSRVRNPNGTHHTFHVVHIHIHIQCCKTIVRNPSTRNIWRGFCSCFRSFSWLNYNYSDWPKDTAIDKVAGRFCISWLYISWLQCWRHLFLFHSLTLFLVCFENVMRKDDFVSLANWSMIARL